MRWDCISTFLATSTGATEVAGFVYQTKSFSANTKLENILESLKNSCSACCLLNTQTTEMHTISLWAALGSWSIYTEACLLSPF